MAACSRSATAEGDSGIEVARHGGGGGGGPPFLLQRAADDDAIQFAPYSVSILPARPGILGAYPRPSVVLTKDSAGRRSRLQVCRDGGAVEGTRMPSTANLIPGSASRGSRRLPYPLVKRRKMARFDSAPAPGRVMPVAIQARSVRHHRDATTADGLILLGRTACSRWEVGSGVAGLCAPFQFCGEAEHLPRHISVRSVSGEYPP